MQSTTEITAYWSDCDPMGHVNNAKYFTYMEQGRVALFKKLFKIEKNHALNATNFPFILAEISCRFLKPVLVDQVLIVSAKITEIKNSSYFIEYELIEKLSGEKVAQGRSAQVWFDYKTGKPMKIPDSFKKIMSPSV